MNVEDKWRELVEEGYTDQEAYDYMQKHHKFMTDLYFRAKINMLLYEITDYLRNK